MISFSKITSERKAKNATFRFYEELNDFLPEEKRKRNISYSFTGFPTIKDAIEAMGIPHIEVDLILVNGKSVAFDYPLADQDNISVYPVFESLNISNMVRLRRQPLRITKFILDVHLGKLAKYLRLTGFDTYYDKNYTDTEIIKRSLKDKRIILTRDIGLLKHKKITHGYWMRSQDPVVQLKEVIRKFDLSDEFNPFKRCMRCNGLIIEVPKEEIFNELQPNTKQYYNEFYRCTDCKNIYWKGSHYNRMIEFIESFRKETG